VPHGRTGKTYGIRAVYDANDHVRLMKALVTEVAEDFAVYSPGRNTKRGGGAADNIKTIYIPPEFSKHHFYLMYLQAIGSDVAYSYNNFLVLWRRNLKHVRYFGQVWGECDLCRGYQVLRGKQLVNRERDQQENKEQLEESKGNSNRERKAQVVAMVQEIKEGEAKLEEKDRGKEEMSDDEEEKNKDVKQMEETYNEMDEKVEKSMEEDEERLK